eukprot:360503-Chlamydomonas_euryale.AAC.8
MREIGTRHGEGRSSMLNEAARETSFAAADGSLRCSGAAATRPTVVSPRVQKRGMAAKALLAARWRRRPRSLPKIPSPSRQRSTSEPTHLSPNASWRSSRGRLQPSSAVHDVP